MHAHFFVRGKRQDVETFFKFLETANFPFNYKNKEGEEKSTVLTGVLRYSLFGTWEYIFPEPFKDVVLTSLRFHEPLNPNTKKMKVLVNYFRKILGLKKAPEFKRDQAIFLPVEEMKNVHIIPLGVKYDEIMTFPNGCTHEAL